MRSATANTSKHKNLTVVQLVSINGYGRRQCLEKINDFNNGEITEAQLYAKNPRAWSGAAIDMLPAPNLALFD